MEAFILSAVEQGVMTITLNRPDRLNSFNDLMHHQLAECLKQAERDDGVRCLLITGAGRGFCAGQDLNDRNVDPSGPPPDLGMSVERFYNPLARRLAALVLAAVMLCVAVPAAFAEDAAPGATTIGGANTTLIPEEEENCLSWLFGSKDKITLPYLNIKGKGLRRNVSLDLVDCLVGITYTELGSIGSYVSASAAQEAWKAQAVAIHSYLEYHKQYGSSANALIYTPVEDIPSSARSAIRKAVESVKDEVLTCNGSVIDAVWSASAGYNTQTGVYGTCSSLDAWGSDVPYLKSVESPYERQYHEKMRRIIGKDYDYVEYNDSRTGEPYQSADTTHKDLGGFVQYNTLVSNGRSYRYIGQFVSSRYCFDFGTDAAGVPCMYYYGFGHGVGMSQCGAVGYAAEEGMGYRDILKHYYSGVSIRTVGSGTSSGGGLFGWLRRLLGM